MAVRPAHGKTYIKDNQMLKGEKNMANKKMSRVISILAVLAMLAMLVPTVAFAANTVEMTTVPTYNKDQGTIEVAGTISGDATDNADITMMAIRSEAPLSEIPDSIISDSNCIMYIDQKPANSEKSASILGIKCASVYLVLAFLSLTSSLSPAALKPCSPLVTIT